ncbi:hypothetical protein ACLQ24_15035 [Micromonospora sp. DT4]|uniref:hypothetical protein n=1 Tax=Micromonospora sp. DT4 TaxID=3393438 RepID=UPI003CEBACCE
MPPRRRPRSWLAGRLRSAAGAVQRLAGRVEPTGLPPERPADVPRRFGEPPQHWLDLVAAHAPGLLRELDLGVDVAVPTHDQFPQAMTPLRWDRSGGPVAETSRPSTDRTGGRAAAAHGRSDDPTGTGDPRPAAGPPGGGRDHVRHEPEAGGPGKPEGDRRPPVIRPATPGGAGSARSGGAGSARSGGAGSATGSARSGGGGGGYRPLDVGDAGRSGGPRRASVPGRPATARRAATSAPVCAPGRGERTAAPVPPSGILDESSPSRGAPPPKSTVDESRCSGRGDGAYWPSLPGEPGRPGGLPEQPAGGHSPQHATRFPELHASRHRPGRYREPARGEPQHDQHAAPQHDQHTSTPHDPRNPYGGLPRGGEVRRRELRSGNGTGPVEVVSSGRWPVSAAFPSAAVAPGVDPWPALPDDGPLWTVPGAALDAGHERRLDREQAGG